MPKQTTALAIAYVGILFSASCSSVKFAERPPAPPGYGPYALLIGDIPHDVYSSEIVLGDAVSAILGKPLIPTLLTLEPPRRDSGWLARQFKNRQEWQLLRSGGSETVTVHDVKAEARSRAHALRGRPSDLPQEWWLVGVEPIRLAAFRYEPGEEVDRYGADENGRFSSGAKGFTHAEAFLVDGDDLDRPVEAVAVYTGALYTGGREPEVPVVFEEDKLDVRLTHNEFTIGELIERYATEARRE